MNMRTVLFLSVVLVASGCASVRQKCRTEVTQPDGTVEVRETEAIARIPSLWDGKQSLKNLRLSNGRTHSIGLASSESESSTTNAVAALEALARIVEGLR